MAAKLQKQKKMKKKKKSGDYSLLRPRGTCHPSMVPANITHAGCVTLSAEHQVRGDPHCLPQLPGSPGIRRKGLRSSGSPPARGATSVSAHVGILHSCPASVPRCVASIRACCSSLPPSPPRATKPGWQQTATGSEISEARGIAGHERGCTRYSYNSYNQGTRQPLWADEQLAGIFSVNSWKRA